jgi:hypothetical protein
MLHEVYLSPQSSCNHGMLIGGASTKIGSSNGRLQLYRAQVPDCRTLSSPISIRQTEPPQPLEKLWTQTAVPSHTWIEQSTATCRLWVSSPLPEDGQATSLEAIDPVDSKPSQGACPFDTNYHPSL